MAQQKKLKRTLTFDRAHLGKLIRTLKFVVSIKNKPGKTREPYMQLSVQSGVDHFTDDDKWLLGELVKFAGKGGFNVEIGPCDSKIDINDPGVFD